MKGSANFCNNKYRRMTCCRMLPAATGTSPVASFLTRPSTSWTRPRHRWESRPMGRCDSWCFVVGWLVGWLVQAAMTVKVPRRSRDRERRGSSRRQHHRSSPGHILQPSAGQAKPSPFIALEGACRVCLAAWQNATLPCPFRVPDPCQLQQLDNPTCTVAPLAAPHSWYTTLGPAGETSCIPVS